MLPEREGYVLDGWSVTAGSDKVTYTPRTLIIADEGTVLYAVWKEE